MTDATPPGGDDYRRHVLVGVLWTGVQKWAVRVAGVVTYAVLGRLLGPADIGLAALALAVIGILTILADVGTSAFLVRAPTLQSRDISTAFWSNLALCSGAAVLVVALCGPLAVLVGQPRIAPVLRALAPLLVLAGLAATPTALLVRRLQMRTLALRDLLAATLSMSMGIAAAVAGAGIWALVAQSLVQAFVGLVVVWLTAHWRPSLEFSRATATSLVRFGGAVSGANLVQSIHDRLEQFVLGSIAGPVVLGYWTVGTRVLNLVYDVSMAVLDSVALPVFARAREDTDLLRKTFATATAHGLALLVPVLALVGVTAPVLVPAVFGERWTPAVAPMQVLCLTYALGGLSWFSRPAFIARARTGAELTVSVAGLVLHLAAVAAAAPHGLLVLAWAVTGEAVLMVALRVWLQGRLLDISPAVYRRSLLVLVAGTGMVSVAAVAAWLGGPPDWPTLIVASVLGVLAYLGLSFALNRPMLDEMVSDLRRVVRR